MDDWVQSCTSEVEALELATSVEKIQLAANFKLHKWISNSPIVLQRFATTTTRTAKELQKQPKALGMKWNIDQDTFSFDLTQLLNVHEQGGGKTPTKREMLGFIMSLFDPLGLVAHQAVVGRLILRETWKLDCNWDEKIPKEITTPWCDWIGKMSQLRIPRWCGIRNVNRELHIFVGASERAMAAVAYIKGTGNESNIVSLAATKCKLAPTKLQSIPRLELQAAVLGIKLAEMVRSASTVNLTRTVYWTDAYNTIWWINSSKWRYKQFVALRVAEILSSSNAADWRWVPGTANPADIATKPDKTRIRQSAVNYGAKVLTSSNNKKRTGQRPTEWNQNNYQNHSESCTYV